MMEKINYLEVEAGKQMLLIELPYITTILPMVKLSHGMDEKSLLLGVMNYHGQSVPVYDLAFLLGHSNTPIGKDTLIILCEVEQKLIGFITSKVQGVFQPNLGQQQLSYVQMKPFVTNIIECESGTHWIIDLIKLLTFYNLFEMSDANE